MCGIVGIIAFKDGSRKDLSHIDEAVKRLKSRGPDCEGVFHHNMVSLGHTRLSIIDLSDAASQPMTDESGRFTIIYNGEVYNFQELKADLIAQGVSFVSQSDTEVILKLYIHEGEGFLQKLNGFFAFAIYDNVEESVFIARDRLGIKPLLYYHDNEKVIFSSEMKALLTFPIDKGVDDVSLYQYLQLNYIPPAGTIFNNVTSLPPGTYMVIKNGKIQKETYYRINYNNANSEAIHQTYDDQKIQLEKLLDRSVKDRMVADVPIGAFLSGGIDSSIIVALASRHTKQLDTFTIGYKNEPYFDETKYANLVAKKFKTNHTVFSLTNEDLYECIHEVLDNIDNPFADPSLPAVYILSKNASKHVKVALSGDGGDELFAGYNKHRALHRAMSGGVLANIATALMPLWRWLPRSRDGQLSNLARQYYRFAEGMALPHKERYWKWCSYLGESTARNLLSDTLISAQMLGRYEESKKEILSPLEDKDDLNQILFTDTQLVLGGDMLLKVDAMSMANSLEVRVPLLDHHIVEYAFSLPQKAKIDHKQTKKILKDTFRNLLPQELYNRPKHGFDVPLLKWFRTELKSTILNDILADDFIQDQKIFNIEAVRTLKKQLFSSNPGDVQATIWALVVFQFWWKKWMM